MTVLTKRKNSLKTKSNSKTKKVKINSLLKKEKEFKKKSDICHKTKCASEYKRYNELNISTAKGRDKACSSYNILSKKYDKCSNVFYKNSGLKKVMDEYSKCSNKNCKTIQKKYFNIYYKLGKLQN